MDAMPAIRETKTDDIDAVYAVHRRAFGGEEEADLVVDLLADPSAHTCLSLIAEQGGAPVGHILFTFARIDGPSDAGPAAILAPLAVDPNHQKAGIGRALVENGLRRLERNGTAMVFVLGDPAYYGRFGFEPALAHDLLAPYALVPEYEDGWRVRLFHERSTADKGGRLVCADALMRPELWGP